jgi:hypothetical protein
MEIDALTHPTDFRAGERALAEAAATAGFAPSIHHTQPWRWRLTGSILDLHLERGRIAPADPDGRLAILSCGAALHHARVALAAGGWHVTVTRMVLGADRDLLARLRVTGRSPADPLSARLLRAIPARPNDRRLAIGTEVDPADLAAITTAGDAYDTRLHRLPPGQIAELAALTDHALLRAAGGAAVVVLYGSADQALNWLRAGEALSAVWLTATERGVSLRPLSALADSGDARQAMRAMVPGIGHPYLVVRLDRIDPADAGGPRAPAAQIIERF